MRAANLAYAAVFVVVLPIALWTWAALGDGAGLPAVPPAALGWCLAAAGGVLFLWAAACFIAKTGRLPVSTDRPSVAVLAGPYALASDPLYVGFCIAVAGVFCLAPNRFGFWIVAPALIAATAAFTWGYENHRRPPRAAPALLDWPAAADRPATLREKTSAVLTVLLVGSAAQALDGPLPIGWPVLAACVAGAALFIAVGRPDARALRSGVIVCAIAGLAAIICLHGWSIAPGIVFGLALAAFAGAERHRVLVAALLAAGLLIGLPFGRLPVGGSVLAGGLAIGAVLAAALPPAHRAALRGTEWIANSWSSWRLGPVRIINYAVYPFAAALAGALIFQAAAPGHPARAVLAIGLCGVIGAGVWGQLIENTGKLARPFGYFGAMMGGTFGVVAVSLSGGGSLLAIAGAAALAAPWIQAIGRLRCLVQGCCHGKPTAEAANGIVYRREESRVLRIARLGGVAVHPTPLYSIYGNIVLGLLLWRLALTATPAALIAGIYLIGAGAARFVEEAYRGEPQTRVIFDLKIYQWLAIGEMLTGAVLTALPAPPLALHALTPLQWAVALSVAVIAGAAMGVDFPGSQRRFSQLTPRQF